MTRIAEMMAMGSFLSERVRAGDVATFDQHAGPPSFSASDFGDFVVRFSRRRMYEFSAAWHDNGFPAVDLGHKHAASLMATNTRAESIREARAPWGAFLVRIPHGLVSHDIKQRVRFADGTEREDGVITRHALYALVYVNGYVTAHIADEQGVFDVVKVETVAELGETSKHDPTGNLVARLVLGVCMEMTTSVYKGGSLRPQPVKRDSRTGEPRTWTFRLSRDVKVDCRAAVRDYCAGVTHSAPSVQCLVRGHWRQQPCGKGGADRRNIFVEPYWRGPEDADIALRKHRVSAGPASEAEASC